METPTENLYPNLTLQDNVITPQDQKVPQDIQKVIISEADTQKILDSKLNESRIKYMLQERDKLIKDLKHYHKILKRWKKIDFGIKVASVGIIATTSIAAGITGTLVAPFLVPIYLPAASAILE